MLFSPFGQFCNPPYAGCTVPSEQVILLCNEAVGNSLPLIAYSQQILPSVIALKLKD